MIKRILVALDGSRLAEQALPLASALASTLDAELLLATAFVTIGPFERADLEGPLSEAGGIAAQQYLAATEQELSTTKGLRVRSTAAEGRPHIAISSLCDREAVDLVVMTTHGRSGVSRWTMGSVADKVLRTTDTPLILIHPTAHGTSPSSINRVVVALDGSELAEAALPLVQRVASSLNVKVHLVRAVVPSSLVFGAEYLPGTLPVLEEMETDAKEYLKATAAKLRSKRLTVTAVVRTGIPAEAILAEASEVGDMVVMSTHGRSGVDRWFLGSVADAVVRHGDIPVLVVRSWATPRNPEYEDTTPLDKPAYVETTPLIVAGIPPVIPVPEMNEQEETAVVVGKARPARRTNRPEARGRQLR